MKLVPRNNNLGFSLFDNMFDDMFRDPFFTSSNTTKTYEDRYTRKR